MKLSTFWGFLALTMAWLTYLADARVGHGLYLWLFTILGYVLVRSVRFGKVSWFYTYMVIFFFLGCWVKVVIHHIFNYPFIEPTGDFYGAEFQWQSYYETTYAFMAAFILSKGIHVVVSQNAVGNTRWYFVGGPVDTTTWFLLVFLSAVFYLVNNVAAFNVTGVHPLIVLPFSLNAPIAFMALTGIAVIASIFLSRDFLYRQQISFQSTSSVLAIAGMASISMASRAAIIMQAIPMLVGVTYLQTKIYNQKISLRPFLMFGVFFVVALIGVAVYRINLYMGADVNSETLYFAATENVMLAVDRWVGAEQVLVGVSEPTRSVDLFFDLLQDDPSEGVKSTYQTLAGSKYEFMHTRTFLTLPGYFGLFSLSGSILFSFFGLFFVVTMGIIYEYLFVRHALFGQAICVSVVSAAIANSITQLSFPRLVLPFFVQMSLLILLLHFVLRRNFIRIRQ